MTEPEPTEPIDYLIQGDDPMPPVEVAQLAVLLAQSVPAVPPPAHLRTRLLAQIAPDVAAYTQRAEESVWEPLPVPGLSRRILFADRTRNTITFLLKAEPNATIPVHHHSGPEEFLLLEGDLIAPDGRRLVPGDYQRSDGHTNHGLQRTLEGCIALLIAAYTDHMPAHK